MSAFDAMNVGYENCVVWEAVGVSPVHILMLDLSDLPFVFSGALEQKITVIAVHVPLLVCRRQFFTLHANTHVPLAVKPLRYFKNGVV